ncbi:MAG: ester cyclase [Candidatus Dadabacteria bacterium]
MNLNTSKLHEEVMEAWNRHDAGKLATYYDENITWRDPAFPETLKGKDAVMNVFKVWDTAFPDFKLKVLTKLVEEDTIAFEMEFTGTHTGPLNVPGMEIPPTNRKVSDLIGCFSKVRNGKVVEVHNFTNPQSMMVQLGVQPAHAEQHTF